MCCRYYIGETVDMEIIVAEMMKSPLVPVWQKKRAIVTEGEVRPTDIVPVIAPDRSGKRKVFPINR